MKITPGSTYEERLASLDERAAHGEDSVKHERTALLELMGRKQFTINGKQIEFNSHAEYSDFYLEDGIPKPTQIRMGDFLNALETGALQWSEVEDTVRMWSRWLTEAPRKRGLRELKNSGINVLTKEHLFESEEGGKFIDRLENTGKIATKLCEIFGVKTVTINNEGPEPVSLDEALNKHNEHTNNKGAGEEVEVPVPDTEA